MRHVFVPINLKDYHWLLMHLDMEQSTFNVIDSMGCSQKEASTYVDLVKQFLQDYFHATKSIEGSKKVQDNTNLWTVATPASTK